MRRFLSMAAIVMYGAAAFAQYPTVLKDGTNVTVNSAWTNDTVWVGQDTASNTLSVINGGAVLSTNVYVGASSNATDNSISVTGTGSWNIEDTLTIGSGTNNTVSVGGGGTIFAGDLVIYSNNTFNLNSDGTLFITGTYDADLQTNVNWTSGGTLSIGGKLTNSTGLAGEGRTLRIDGGSWDSTGDISVDGANNTLAIAAGGTVTNDNGFVGSGTSNLNNTVGVSGEGSFWLNNGDLYIGSTNGSIGNTVTVSDDGRVAADDLFIADGNSFNLNNGGTLAISGGFNLSQQSNLIWNSGGLLSLGGELSGLPIANLVAGGTTNLSTFAYIDGGHDIELTGTNALQNLGNTNLIVGYLSSGSDLVISDGKRVVGHDGYIGWGGNAANNSVLVSGAGSTWTNAGGNLYVGAYWSGTNLINAGAGNKLVIEDDGWVNVGEAVTNLAGTSMLVASTNGGQLIVGHGSVEMDGSLQLGLSTNLTGTAIIRSGGTLSVDDLEVKEGSLLDLRSGGTFATAGNFDRSVRFEWGGDSHLSVGGDLSGMDITNGSYYLDGGRDLTLAGGAWNELSGNDLIVGYNDSDSILTVSRSNGILTSANGYIGWGTNSANNKVVLEEGGTWNNSGDLWVGYGGSANELNISSGGSVTNGNDAYIGNVNALDNSATVNGSNSIWHIGNNLFIGGASNSVNNELRIADNGQVQVAGAVILRSGNTISLETDGSLTAGSAMNVYSNSMLDGTGAISFGATNATLSFYGAGISLSTGIVFVADTNFLDNKVAVYDGTFTVAGTNGQPYIGFQTLSLSNSVLNGAGLLDFETVNLTEGMIDPAGDETGRIELNGVVTLDGTTYRAQVINNQWDQLVFSGAGQINLTNISASVFVPFIPTTTNDIVILTAANLAGNFSATDIDVRSLLYDGELLVTNNAVQVVLEPVDGETISSTLGYAATESVRAGFNGMKNMVFTRTKQLRRNVVATAHAIPNEVRLLTNTNAPAGALGPGDQNTIFDMHVWLQHYSGKGDYDAEGVSDPFALYNNGTTIGLDKLVGEALAVGLNYTYTRSATRAVNGDRMDTETYWFGAYGEWVGVDGLYIDTIAGYGYSSFDSQRFAENYHGTASYNGHAFGAAADLGQYYYYGNDVALSPYLGLHALTLINESHSETEDAGGVIRVDEVDHSWLESAIGLKLRHRFDSPVGRFQTTGYAEWTYDFIQDDVSSSMSSGNLAAANTAIISPAESGINVGLGYSWICTDYMEIGLGYNGRFSDGYEEHAASAMLDLMF